MNCKKKMLVVGWLDFDLMADADLDDIFRNYVVFIYGGVFELTDADI